MTDAEKMLEMMKAMGSQASEQTEVQMDTAAQTLRMMYDSYVRAGFSPKMSFELVKEILHASIVGANKK